MMNLVNLRSDYFYAICLTASFLFVGTITAAHHEMWRDEIQAWLIARDSSSFTDLFRNIKYEGHPGLWHVFLLILSRITPSPIIMQPFHLLIAAATVYLFGRYSPFTKLQKLLFAFGYYSSYEYSILCRNYALGLLLICLFCILFQNRYAKFIWVSAVLFLLSHTSVHALIITIVTSFVLLVDYLLRRKRILAEMPIKEWRILLGFGLIAAGVITSVMQIKPPTDTGFAVEWFRHYDAKRLKDVINVISRAFILLPEANLHFWGSQLLKKYQVFTKIELTLSCLLMAWFSLVLLRKPTALLTYLLGTVGLLSFFYIKYFGGIRHHGFLFLLFIMVVWIYNSEGERQKAKGEKNKGRRLESGIVRTLMAAPRWLEKSLNPMLILILSIHFVGGLIAVSMDYRHVFSYGKAAAEFIKARQMQEMLMVGERDYAVSTIVGYLEKDQIYYPRGNRYGSFIIWDKARTQEVSDAQVIQKAMELGVESRQEILVILNHELSSDLIANNSLAELAKFSGSTVGDEGFYLYLLPLR